MGASYLKALKKRLRSLSLKEFVHDAKVGNITFDKLVREIKREGEDIKDSDLFIDLFVFWQTSTNRHFKEYVRRLEDDLTDKKVTQNYENIVTMVETKYTDLEADNEWNAIDPRTQEILAFKKNLKEMISTKENDRKKNNYKKRVWNGEWAEKSKNGETTKTIKGKEVKWCEKCNEGNGG